MEKKLEKILKLVCILGIIIGSYLSYYKFNLNTDNQFSCGFSGCDTVQISKYAEFFGVPVAYLGLAFFILLFIMVLVKSLKKYAFYWSLFGVAFLSYLTYLEFFVIKAICPWCLVCYGLTIVAAGILYYERKNNALLSV